MVPEPQEQTGLATDLATLDSYIEEVQQTLHNYYDTESSHKGSGTLFTTQIAVERTIERYAEKATEIEQRYDDFEPTIEPEDPAYQYQRAKAEDIARIKNRTAYLQELHDHFPDEMEKFEGGPLY